MRLVHAADLHIGYRSLSRLAPDGMNQREADVALTFSRVIDRIIAIAPDLVVVAGDVFHHSRPTNNAIAHAFAEFSRLVAALPGAAIVIAAGNHDLGGGRRDRDTSGVVTGYILPVFSHLGIHVANVNAKRFRFEQLSVLAVPDAPGLARPVLSPDPEARYNVLVMHGEAQGVTQGGAEHHASKAEVSRDELGAPAWDYVALGHYHQYEQIAQNAFYSGAIDFTSSNPWQEIGTPKGIVERNLATGEHTFHVVEPARQYVDLPPIAADGMTASEIQAAVIDTIDAHPGGIDGKVVRLIVRDVPRLTRKEVDHRALRSQTKLALDFKVDMRLPPLVASPAVQTFTAMNKAAYRARTLRDQVSERLGTFELPPGVDRAEFAARGLEYLDQVGSDPLIREPAESAPLFEQQGAA